MISQKIRTGKKMYVCYELKSPSAKSADGIADWERHRRAWTQGLRAANGSLGHGLLVKGQTAGFQKATFYAELSSGTRPNCRPLLRFKDNLKANLLSTGIEPKTWEDLSCNRSIWRKACFTGVQYFEDVRIANAVESAADGKVLRVKRGTHYPCSRPVFTAREHGP